MKVSTKIVWIIITILCILALCYIWLIGLPIPKYKMIDDHAAPAKYTVQLAPYTFFDVCMSENEKLLRTDYETFFSFTTGDITKNVTQIIADPVDVAKEVYGRSDGTLYRKFDDATITIYSTISMSQAYKALTENEPYRVEGYFQDLEVNDKDAIPTAKKATIYQKIDDGVYGMRDDTYHYDEYTNSVRWYGGDNRFYSTARVHGVMFDTIQQTLAKAKACYGVTFTSYFMGDDYYLFEGDGYVIGIKAVNRNTQLVCITNAASQVDGLLYTIEGDDIVGKED